MKGNFLKSGFTLVEVIVILFIMSMGLVGILGLIVQNIQSQSYNKSNLIAYQLAQEGIELIRRVRDSNWRASLPYDDKLAAGQYYMDYEDAAPNAYNPAMVEQIIMGKNAANFYIHDTTATATPFSRLITIQTIDDHSFRVDSSITWAEHGRNYVYDLETILYNWR
ncbi:MAG: prepilin-type N-terminal cleavage/methylation domain-containing protein [Patescibacteria group bacterium]|jgi:Tfp pilus assembly protein PilV